MQSLQMIPLYYHTNWTDLLAQHLNHPLLDVYADNLVQIYPRHAFRGIIPTRWGKIIKVTLNNSQFLITEHCFQGIEIFTYSCKLNTSHQLLHY